jgi:hypothetical protein
MLVETPAEGSNTVIAVSDTRFDSALPDSCFTQETLEDVRREAVECNPAPASTPH